ncbi:MAG: NAD(P)/FAD-dependent oxidoreductase [Chloroflexota bacterium]
MIHNGVLGGGALGLTVALRLAQRGEAVTLLEREPAPGGLAAGFKLGPSYLEKFYHHLFRSDTSAVALINELGLGDKLAWPRPKTSILYGGKRYQLDSPSSVLRFSPLSLPDRLRLGASLGYLRLEPNYHRLEHTTASAWMRRWMGDAVYNTVWRPLLESKFGDRHEDIAMSWFWARIHLRSASLGYLRGGFQQLYDELVREIRQLGGEVLLGTAVQEVRKSEDGTFEIQTADRTIEVVRVISTLPTALTAKLVPELPADYVQTYGKVDSLGAHCAILLLDRPLTDVYWLNINDPDYPFLALVEHTNYMPKEDYGGKHVVYLGNYLPVEHPLFAAGEEALLAQYLPALERVNPDFHPGWITDMHVFKAPFAQPIVSLGYADRLPPHDTPIPGLYLANMSQVYPQDRGQNYSIAMANRLVESITGETAA